MIGNPLRQQLEVSGNGHQEIVEVVRDAACEPSDRLLLLQLEHALTEALGLHRLFVAGSLWIEASEERANANLRSALWRLRRPGHPLIDVTVTHVGLAANVVVDIRQAEARARRFLSQPDGWKADPYELLLSGDLLPDWYEDWVLVERERYDAWLDPLSSDPDDLLELLVPAAPGRLEAYAVSKAVSSVKNNGPHLLDPLPPDGEDPQDTPTTLF